MLKLRKHLRSDIPYRIKWLNDPRINIHLWEKHTKGTTLEQQEAWLDAYEKTEDKIIFTLCDDATPIGWIGLTHINVINFTADVFIAIGEVDYQGKWYGRKAFSKLLDYGFWTLKLSKIALAVNETNTIARRLYESLGFQMEEILANEEVVNGKPVNILILSIFAEDWRR